jgi:hypothetical protein
MVLTLGRGHCQCKLRARCKLWKLPTQNPSTHTKNPEREMMSASVHVTAVIVLGANTQVLTTENLEMANISPRYYGASKYADS